MREREKKKKSDKIKKISEFIKKHISYSIMIYLLCFLLPLVISWQKQNYSFFENLTEQEFAKNYLGLQLFDLNLPSFEFYANMYEKGLPDFFDAREKWPQCIRKMRNQVD